jgi:hypothetical protein
MPLIGCDPIKLKSAADQMKISLNESTEKFLEAVDIAVGESDEWKAEVARLADKFHATAKDFTLDAGTQSRMFVEFALRRLKDNPKAVDNITALVKDGKYVLALSAFQAFQKANPLGQAAEIGQANPVSLSFNWISATEYQIEGVDKVVRLNGWDIPFRDAGLKAEVRGVDDKPLRDVTRHLTATTHYDAVIDIAQGSGMKFTPDDRAILITHRGNQICQVALTWGPPYRQRVPASFLVTCKWFRILECQFGDDEEDFDVDITAGEQVLYKVKNENLDSYSHRKTEYAVGSSAIVNADKLSHVVDVRCNVHSADYKNPHFGYEFRRCEGPVSFQLNGKPKEGQGSWRAEFEVKVHEWLPSK